MATSYKTPGVYIEEISKLPPSVAQVETAIPAFIGYTEKATKLDGNDLIFVPTRIKSLQDYEAYYGTVNKDDIKINIQVSYDISGNISSVAPSLDSSSVITKMYYALQMYFANGGGPCYIVSVGVSTQIPSPLSINTIVRTGTASISLDFETAIGQVGYEDEVTLFVFPDMHRLDDDDYYPIYDKALAQCKEHGDRFTVVDVRMHPDSSSNLLGTDNPFTLLRDTSMNYLKYGAAYYPDLKTILNYIYDDSNVTVFNSSGANSLDSFNLEPPSTIHNTLVYNTVKAEIRNQLKI